MNIDPRTLDPLLARPRHTPRPSDTFTVGNLTHVRLPNGQGVTVEAGRVMEDLLSGQVTMDGHFTVSIGDVTAYCAAF
jgi:hypothetical protein